MNHAQAADLCDTLTRVAEALEESNRLAVISAENLGTLCTRVEDADTNHCSLINSLINAVNFSATRK